MKWTGQELGHVQFLAQVVLEGHKKAIMPDMLQLLSYIVKSVDAVELPDSVAEELSRLILAIELSLKEENDRMQEIRSNLSYPRERRPLG